MITVGTKVYFIIHEVVHSGIIDYIEGEIFHIEGLAGCSGPHEFHLSMIGVTIFLNQEDAMKVKNIPFVQLELMC